MSEPVTLKENKMGTMPVGKLLLQMAIPLVLSMLVQAAYNVVDSIYISNYSDNALTALSLSFPIQNLLIGCATGIAVGATAMISRCLGSKNYEEANRTAATSVLLAGTAMVLFLLFGLFLVEPFFRMQSDVEATVQAGISYLRICTVASGGILGEVLFERFLQSSGRTAYTMATQGVGAIINIIFDPIFIFGRFGFPEMGAAGAAWATVLGQFVAFFLAFFFNHRKNPDLKLTFHRFRLEWAIVRPVLTVALPTIIMMSVGSIMTFGFNQILQGFSETSTNVFGVYFKLQSFVFMPIFGMNNAMIPVIAYNYGARKPQRIMKAVRYCAIAATCVMALGLATFQLIPDVLLSPFGHSEEFLRLGAIALRIISLSFLFAGVCIVFGASFQALGNGIYSTIVSFARQIVVLLPVAYLLSRTGNVDLVWWSFPIAEVASTLVSVYCFIRLYRQKVRPLFLEEAK